MGRRKSLGLLTMFGCLPLSIAACGAHGPAASNATSRLAATGDHDALRHLLREMVDAHRHTNQLWLSRLERVPASELARPRANEHGSIIGLLDHCLFIEQHFLRLWRGDSDDFNEVLDNGLVSGVPTLAALRARQEASDRELVEILARSDSDLHRIVEVSWGGGAPAWLEPGDDLSIPSPSQRLRLRVYQLLFSLVIDHSHHHRGQVHQICMEALGLELPPTTTFFYYFFPSRGAVLHEDTALSKGSTQG